MIPSPGLELWQNAPNPFASITKFVCEAKESTEAEIAVYNIRGQKVRKIHSGILERGSTEFSWDGFDDNKRFVANEIYLIRAHNGKSSRLIKVLKLR
ncbi:MAG: FlgD immunoglobulin-like domain containing protein [Candidatus Cloacimonadaceae bacterium]|nr:FlgD immunoglobulin-like domain containing protein [Candidatus Cloacimonadaceae bacterium]MDP3115370.1 FlgD immunoglobulin-like domain containing protein [Candidatus Cloacimonadaceae bacterium]